ncbi:hypothetical protein FDECE_5762 [Fusarium decemcellulare]|nr:hypothetical protein FDECE_5762 [Fusarium decemcellulare]
MGQRTFTVIPAIAQSGSPQPPMTSHAAKRRYKEANRMPRRSRSEERREERRLQDRIREEQAAEVAEVNKVKAARKRRAAETKKVQLKQEARRERIRRGLPPQPTSPTQNTIKSFLQGKPNPVPQVSDQPATSTPAEEATVIHHQGECPGASAPGEVSSSVCTTQRLWSEINNEVASISRTRQPRGSPVVQERGEDHGPKSPSSSLGSGRVSFSPFLNTPGRVSCRDSSSLPSTASWNSPLLSSADPDPPTSAQQPPPAASPVSEERGLPEAPDATSLPSPWRLKLRSSRPASPARDGLRSVDGPAIGDSFSSFSSDFPTISQIAEMCSKPQDQPAAARPPLSSNPRMPDGLDSDVLRQFPSLSQQARELELDDVETPLPRLCNGLTASSTIDDTPVIIVLSSEAGLLPDDDALASHKSPASTRTRWPPKRVPRQNIGKLRDPSPCTEQSARRESYKTGAGCVIKHDVPLSPQTVAILAHNGEETSEPSSSLRGPSQDLGTTR